MTSRSHGNDQSTDNRMIMVLRHAEKLSTPRAARTASSMKEPCRSSPLLGVVEAVFLAFRAACGQACVRRRGQGGAPAGEAEDERP
jgi:hypothetical protein